MGKCWVEHISEWEQVICKSETESLLVFYCKRLAQIYGFKIAQIWYLTVLEAKGLKWVLFSSVAQSCPSLCEPHGLQHVRPPCPSPTPGVYSDSCPLSRWCHPTISSSVVPFSSCLQFFSASGSFQMSQFFASGGQSIGVSASASVLPLTIQDLFPLGWTGWISLQSKGLSNISRTTV